MRQILIADDHEVTRRGIRDMVCEAFPDAEVTEAADGAALHALIDRQRWDMILLDVIFPGANIVDTVQRIRRSDADVPVLVLTAATEMEYVVQTMKAGANGVVHKHVAANDLMRALHQVSQGQNYLHPDTAVEIARLLNEPPTTRPHQLLSERELTIFKRIALGQAIKEIAFELELSDKTVATYLARIRTKTGLSSAVDIARYALQNGLVQ